MARFDNENSLARSFGNFVLSPIVPAVIRASRNTRDALKSLNKSLLETKSFEVAALVDRFCDDCQSCFFKRQFELHFLLERTARQ